MRPRIQELDKNLAILGIISSIILIIYLSKNIGRMIYVLAGVFSFISCAIWLIIGKNASLEFDQLQSRSLNLVLASLFFILFTFSILSVHFRLNLYERPLIYFILLSLMAGIVVLEILFSQEHQKYFILSQIIIIGLSVAWSQSLIFPSLLGVDPWWHQMFTSKIMEAGFIPDGYSYSRLPIFQLSIALTSLITGLNYKFATMLSVSLAQIICNAAFIFLLGKFLSNNYKIGLLASLLVIIANYHIYMSYRLVPTSLAAVFVPIVLYLLLKMKKDKPLYAVVLSIFFMTTLILTHTVTAMCMAIILFVSWAAFNLYNILYAKKERVPVSLTISVLFTTTMFAWWTYASGHIKALAALIKWGFRIDHFVGAYTIEEALRYMENIPILEQFLCNVGFFSFFAISFIGVFYMISKKGNSISFIVAVTGVVPLAISYLSLIFKYWIIPERWWYFSQILLSIPLAIAVLLFVAQKKNSKFTSFSLFVFVSLLTFLIITSPIANVDSPVLSPNTGVRYAYTDSEMVGAAFFAQSSEKISPDYDYTSVLSCYYDVNRKRILSFDDQLYTGQFLHDGSIKIIRKTIVERPFRLVGAVYRLNYDPNVVLSNSGFNKIYDNSAVTAYL